MRQIRKYPLPFGSSTLALTVDFKVLHCDDQYGQVALWVAEDDSTPTQLVSFAVVPTGTYMPDDAKHVGTVLQAGGQLVWHVFQQEVGF